MPRPALYDLGIVPTLTLTSEAMTTATAADVAELIDLGATDAMLAAARTLATAPGRRLRFDFARQTVEFVA